MMNNHKKKPESIQSQKSEAIGHEKEKNNSGNQRPIPAEGKELAKRQIPPMVRRVENPEEPEFCLKARPKALPVINIPVPKKIKEALDLKITGQGEAKIALATSVFEHYAGRTEGKDGGDAKTPIIPIPKGNILIMGPSGCGKTLLVKSLGEILGVPFISVDCSALTPPSFKGRNPDSILSELYEKADRSKERAEMGIVFMDEFDKISNYETDGSLYEVRMAVQQSLLKLVEGSEMPVPDNTVSKNIDTSKVLFIFGGAFQGMTDNMLKKEEQKMHTAIGFTNQDTHDSSPATDNKACLNPEDLVKYGFIRELVGRITSVERLEGLTLDDFYNIIVNPGNSPIYGYKQFFKGLGINLTFTEPALKEIVRLAYSMDTGARGINSILKKVVEPVTFSIDKIQDDLIESEKNTPAVSDNFKESIVIDFNPSDLFLIIKENQKGKVKSREIIAPIYNQTAV